MFFFSQKSVRCEDRFSTTGWFNWEHNSCFCDVCMKKNERSKAQSYCTDCRKCLCTKHVQVVCTCCVLGISQTWLSNLVSCPRRLTQHSIVFPYAHKLNKLNQMFLFSYQLEIDGDKLPARLINSDVTQPFDLTGFIPSTIQCVYLMIGG